MTEQATMPNIRYTCITTSSHLLLVINHHSGNVSSKQC